MRSLYKYSLQSQPADSSVGVSVRVELSAMGADRLGLVIAGVLKTWSLRKSAKACARAASSAVAVMNLCGFLWRH